MDTVDLPLIREANSPEFGLNALVAQGRSVGIVFSAKGDYRIATAGAFAEAIRQEKSAIEDVGDAKSLYVIKPADITKYGLDLIDPRGTWQNYERLLSAVGATFGLLGVAQRTSIAFVVTESETKADELSSRVKRCRCSDTASHVYVDNKYENGQSCPTFDGGTLACQP